MWWQDPMWRDSITAYVDLLRRGLPSHRFESSIERHKVHGKWIVVVAFLYIDCELNPGGIATQVITEEMCHQAWRCFESRPHYATTKIRDNHLCLARELHGIIEAEEADERVEASGV